MIKIIFSQSFKAFYGLFQQFTLKNNLGVQMGNQYMGQENADAWEQWQQEYSQWQAQYGEQVYFINIFCSICQFLKSLKYS